MASHDEAPFADGRSGSGEPDDSGLGDQYEDLGQLVSRRLGGVAEAAIRFVGEQPVLVAAIAAAVLGMLVGLRLARPKQPAEGAREALEERVQTVGRGAQRAARSVRRGALVDYGALVPLAMRLFENPVVRTYVFRTARQMLARRLR